MRSRKLNQALKNPGRLCINPTDLSIAFPHGGTDLGLVRVIRAVPAYVYTKILAEEFGFRMVEAIRTKPAWAVAAILRGFDDNAIETVWPVSTIGAATGERIIQEGKRADDTVHREGLRLSENEVVLCFSPDQLEAHRMVLFQKAIPMIDEAAALDFATAADNETPVVFVAYPSQDAEAPVQIGFRDDLSLV